MALTRSWPTEHASGNPITHTRLINAGDVARDATGAPRLGIIPAHTNPIVTATATMNVAVGVFNAVTSRTGVGVEKFANDASTNVLLPAAPGSNSRIDVIWARPQFSSASDANNDVVFGSTQGTAGVSPVKPSIPAGAFELATVQIPSTAVATNSGGVVITQTHLYTAPAGATVLIRNATELAAWTPAAGSSVYRLDRQWVERHDGTAWRVAPGTVLASTVSTTSNGTSTTPSAHAKTPVLPVGQKVKIRAWYAASGVSVGGANASLRWLNTGADVTSATGSSKGARIYFPISATAFTQSPLETLFTTTSAAEISAAMFPSTNCVLYGVDEIIVEIVAA